MQSDERVLEFCRGLTFDRLAIAVDAVDVVAADILVHAIRRTAGKRAPIDLGRNLTRTDLRIVEALVAHESALRIAGNIAAICFLRCARALVGPFPFPAGTRDAHTIDHARFRLTGADLAGFRAGQIGRRAFALRLIDSLRRYRSSPANLFTAGK